MIHAEFKFDIDPLYQTRKLKAGLRSKILRISLNKAAAKVKEAVIQEAPKRHGFLKKSIRIRVRNYKNREVWVAVVGPKSDYKRRRGKRKVGPLKGQAYYHRPALYARLVEFGTKHARAKPFLKPALIRTQAVYQQTLTEKIGQLIEAELNKK